MGCCSSKISLETQFNRLWSTAAIARLPFSILLSKIEDSLQGVDIATSISELLEEYSDNDRHPIDIMFRYELIRVRDDAYLLFMLLSVLIFLSKDFYYDKMKCTELLYKFLKQKSPFEKNTLLVSKEGKAFINFYDAYMLICFYINITSLSSVCYIQSFLDPAVSAIFEQQYSERFSYNNQNALLMRAFTELIRLTKLQVEIDIGILESIHKYCRDLGGSAEEKCDTKQSSSNNLSTKIVLPIFKPNKSLLKTILNSPACWVSLECFITHLLLKLSPSRISKLLRSKSYK